MQIFRKIMNYLKIEYDCWFTLLVLLFDLETLRKKKLWKWLVNWSFSELLFLFCSLGDPKSEKNIP